MLVLYELSLYKLSFKVERLPIAHTEGESKAATEAKMTDRKIQTGKKSKGQRKRQRGKDRGGRP